MKHGREERGEKVAASIIVEATVLALVYTGCPASETWTLVRRPNRHRPSGTRHSSVLADDEFASRMKKRACSASFASVMYCVLGRNPRSWSAPLSSWETSHHSDYVVAGPVCLRVGKWPLNGRVAFVLDPACFPRDLVVGPSLAESPSKVGLSTSSRPRIGPILRTGTLRVVGGTWEPPRYRPSSGPSCA